MPGGQRGGGSRGGAIRGSSGRISGSGRMGGGGNIRSGVSRYSRGGSSSLPSSGSINRSRSQSSGSRPRSPSSGRRTGSLRSGKDGDNWGYHHGGKDHGRGGKGPWYKNIYNYYYGDGGWDNYNPYLYGIPFAAYAWDYPWYNAYDYNVRDVYPGDIYFGGEDEQVNNEIVEDKLDDVLKYVKQENNKLNLIDSPFIAISIILIIILLVGIIIKIR
jgi:hypothetical protein